MVLAGKAFALAGGRYNVSVEDLRAAACTALRHRLILNFEGEAEGIDPDAIIEEALDTAEVPFRLSFKQLYHDREEVTGYLARL